MRQKIEHTLEDIGRRRSLFGPRFVGLMRSSAATVTVASAVGVAGLGLAHLETRFPLVRHFNVPVKTRPGLKPFRILHISDLHMFTGQNLLVSFLHKIAREEQFDLVISTGDNLDGADGFPILKDALGPLLKYPGAFVLGSNDYYSPLNQSWLSYLNPSHHKKDLHKHPDSPTLPWLDLTQMMTDAGWLDMTNQTASTTFVVNQNEPKSYSISAAVMGVDDPHIERDRMPPLSQGWADPSTFRLALTHAPYRRVLNKFTKSGADLVLAGHTHGGQVRLLWLGAIVNNCDLPRKYSRGLSLWEHEGTRSWLHVSAGLGTSRTARIRTFCRPEVSILKVCPIP